MNKEHTFNENELIGGLHEALAHAKGKLTLKTTKVPRRTAKMTPASIARIRRRLKASTPVFAAYLNVTPDTVRGWEKNRVTHQEQHFDFWRSHRRRPRCLWAEHLSGELHSGRVSRQNSYIPGCSLEECR